MTIEADFSDRPAELILLLGLHSSGSSCLAGILQELGCWLGEPLRGSWGYEHQPLMVLCETALPTGAVTPQMTATKIRERLTTYYADLVAEAKGRYTTAASKYPQLAFLLTALIDGRGQFTLPYRVAVVDCWRPLDDSVASLIRRGYADRTPVQLRSHQRLLFQSKRRLLARFPHLPVKWKTLLRDPAREIDRIADYCGLTITADQRAAAIASVKR